ncbi:MAG TPA: hypothetical protein VGI46_10340 [Candidatus Acidoferrum sp.]|jgi:hypothetical protein
MASNAQAAQPVQASGSDEKRKKMRSPEHPFINLETALKRAKQFYDVAIRNAISITSAIKGWGYAEGSSGGLQTTAALISFGLLKDEGSGEKRKLQLTQLALRILLDERPDSVERMQFIKQAALMPKIHKQLWEKWGSARPNNIEIRHVLAVEWEPPFNTKSVDDFIAEYEETIRFAKLDDAAPETKQEENAGPYIPKVGDWVQWEVNGSLQLPEPLRVRQLTPDGQFAMLEGSNTGIPIGQLIEEKQPATAATITQVETRPSAPVAPAVPSVAGARMQKDVFSLTEGEVTLFWPSPLSADSMEDLKAWLALVQKKIARTVPAKDSKEAT